MISSKQIQTSYIKLYKFLREVIWPYDIVKAIADLEVLCYQSFPNVESIKMSLTDLKRRCKPYLDYESYQEFEELIDDFQDLLTNSSDVYSKINTRKEGVE